MSANANNFWPETNVLNLFNSSASYLLVSLGLCFVVLIIAHRQRLVVAMTTFMCILVVAISVFGCTTLDGWEFDQDSYMCFMLVLVLCINNSVQISCSFISCPFPSRFIKMQFAYKEKTLTIFKSCSMHMLTACCLFGTQ